MPFDWPVNANTVRSLLSREKLSFWFYAGLFVRSLSLMFEMLGNVCAPVEGMTVADVGARTGLLTRGLLKYGYRVVAVEPNLGMRRMSVDAG